MTAATPTPSPMQRYNATLMEQINAQLRRGFEAGLKHDDCCVARTAVGGVLSVLPVGAAGDQHDVVYGPAPFARCIGYVNTHLAAPMPPEHHDSDVAHEETKHESA